MEETPTIPVFKPIEHINHISLSELESVSDIVHLSWES